MNDLLNQAAYLDRHAGTAFPLALAMPLSFLQAYFETDVHKNAVKAAENDSKLQMAQINRLDGVIKALGHVGKAIAGLCKLLSGRR